MALERTCRTTRQAKRSPFHSSGVGSRPGGHPVACFVVSGIPVLQQDAADHPREVPAPGSEAAEVSELDQPQVLLALQAGEGGRREGGAAMASRKVEASALAAPMSTSRLSATMPPNADTGSVARAARVRLFHRRPERGARRIQVLDHGGRRVPVPAVADPSARSATRRTAASRSRMLL